VGGEVAGIMAHASRRNVPRRRKLLDVLRPNLRAKRVWDVDPDMLRARGIRGLVVDLDNTIVDWNRWEVRDQVKGWAERAGRAGIRCCITSNTRGVDRIKAVADRIGAQWLANAGKPRRGACRRAMELMGTAPRETAVIGDQIFTDVLAGNRLGLATILVGALSPVDFPGTKIARLLERALGRWLYAKGW
jgi:HAD superfamily phosphatase (TIGR01668 family)